MFSVSLFLQIKEFFPGTYGYWGSRVLYENNIFMKDQHKGWYFNMYSKNYVLCVGLLFFNFY